MHLIHNGTSCMTNGTLYQINTLYSCLNYNTFKTCDKNFPQTQHVICEMDRCYKHGADLSKVLLLLTVFGFIRVCLRLQFIRSFTSFMICSLALQW